MESGVGLGESETGLFGQWEGVDVGRNSAVIFLPKYFLDEN